MRTIHVQTHIAEPDLASSIGKFLDSLPAVKMTNQEPIAQPRAGGGLKPEIVILNASGKNGTVYDILSDYKERLPGIAVFLISENHSAEHVVKSIKAGASEYFTLPLDFDSLRKSIEEIRAKTVLVGKGKPSTVYSFISSKGGLGASVLAANTAVALAGQDSSVALCDLGLRTGDSTILLDLVPRTTIADLCRDFQRLDAALLKNSMTTHESGVELLPAPRDPHDSESIQAEQIKAIVEYLPRLYQKTVIDCPSSSLGDSTVGALSCSDRIFIVLDLSIPAIRNAVKLAKEMKRIGIGDDRIDYVVNRFTKNSAISVKEADKNLGKPVFWIVPNAYEDVFSSVTSGIPVVTGSTRSAVAKNIRKLAEKLNDNDSRKDFRGIANLFGKAV